MNTINMKTLRTILMVFTASFFFVMCTEDDDFDNESFDSNELRILKVSEGSTTLTNGAAGVTAKGLELEVVFSTAVNQSDVTNALSLSNGGSFTASFDDTGSIMTLTVATLDYSADYTLSLASGAYGLNGEALANDYSIAFTTSPFITPNVTISSSENAVDEGGSVTLTATLSEATTEDVVVTLSYGGSATLDADFTAETSITVASAETTAAITLTITDDADVEGEEIIEVEITEIVNGNEATEQTASISIIDNDIATDLELKGVLALLWTTSGNNGGKAIHLKAKADIADLSNYAIGVANNGGGTDSIEYRFPAIAVSAGDDILLAREDVTLSTYFGGASEFEHVIQSDAMNQNGDDAIELFSATTLIETYGDANVDGTDQEWEYAGSWAYKLGGTWIYGGIDCAASSTTTQDSDCTYPLYLNALQFQGVMSLELESRDRAIHLRANRDIADLSVYGVGIANNGGGSDGREMDLAAISVSEGDHILFVRGEDEATLTTYFGACISSFDHVITDSGADINFNGDDGVELFEGANSIEIYGSVIDDGTGFPWEYTGSWAYKQFGDVYIYGGLDCTAPGTTNATSSCPYAFCE